MADISCLVKNYLINLCKKVYFFAFLLYNSKLGVLSLLWLILSIIPKGEAFTEKLAVILVFLFVNVGSYGW